MPRHFSCWTARLRAAQHLMFLVALAAPAILAPAQLRGAQGVSIDLSKVTINEALTPGEVFVLPAFNVANPGDETAEYRVSVGGIDGDDLLEPADEWFRFDPAEFRLEPGESQSVEGTLEVPAEVSGGSYRGLIRAQLVSAGEGAQVGAAAAAEILFDIASTSEESGGGSSRGNEWGFPWYAYLIIGTLIVLILIAWLVQRRYRFTITRRAH